jgi:hypothetical protein
MYLFVLHMILQQIIRQHQSTTRSYDPATGDDESDERSFEKKRSFDAEQTSIFTPTTPGRKSTKTD